MDNAINFRTVTFLSRVAPVVATVFVSLQQSDITTEENPSHFAMVVALGVGTVTRSSRLSSRHSSRA